MTMTRVAYVTTDNTGKGMAITTPEGAIILERADPHGVIISAGGQEYRVSRAALPFIGRFFFAAALVLGEDINAGWDLAQDSEINGSGVILP